MKKIIIISLMLTILTMAAVSATDENLTSQSIAVSVDSNLSSIDEEALGETPGTTSDLSDLIDSTPENGILELTKDYKCDEYIHTYKTMTLDGKGHTLDGSKKTNIFDIESNYFTLKNIVFQNCLNDGSGGAVFLGCNNGSSVINCTFVNCRAAGSGSGGGLWFSTNDGDNNNCSVIDCRFVNCTSEGTGGGAIDFLCYFDSKTTARIVNCSFENCSCPDLDGGAINFQCSCDTKNCNSLIVDCSFRNCSANSGGAIKVEDGNHKIMNCSFVHCVAENSGGAIAYEDSALGSVIDCSFIACSAGSGGAIYLYEYEEDNHHVMVSSSVFESNTASEGGAICGGTIFNCRFNKNSKPEIIGSENYATVIKEEEISNNEGFVTLTFPYDASGTVELFVNGTMSAVVEVVQGIAKIDLSKYKGNSLFTFSYSGDDRYPAFTMNYTINVVLTKIVAPNKSVLYTAGHKYSLTVYKEGGILAKGCEVIIKANGKLILSTKTGSNGVVSFKVTQVPGTYKLTITSLERTITPTLTVKHLITLKSATVKKSAKKLVLQATLAKVNKKYLKNK